MAESPLVRTIANRPLRPAVAPREDRTGLGISLMLFALLAFSGIDSCAKWLIQSGLPPMEVVFVRYAVHTVIATAVALPVAGIALFKSADRIGEAWRAIFLLGSTIFNFSAVQYLPLTLTGTIFFSIPLWVCVLSVPFLGERVGWRRGSAIVCGFVGVVIAMRPWSAELHWAVILSLCAAICAAMYGILTRRLAGVDSTATQQVYAGVLASIVIAPFALTGWQWPDTALNWVVLGLIGVFGWGGHQALTIAHRYAPASTLSPFTYVQLIFLSGASWIIFDQPPTVWIFLGAGVVVASGLYIWLRERALARRGRQGARRARLPLQAGRHRLKSAVMTWIMVGLGGALGAMARFGVVGTVARLFGASFPWGTMTVNVLGSLVMGVAAALLVLRAGFAEGPFRPFLMTGLLGGFTTFSAFSLDAIALLEEERFGAAAGYVAGSVVLSVAALFLGLILTRSLLT